MGTGKPEQLTEQAILEQLERILESTYLRRSRRLQEFLRFITQRTLAGQAVEINEYLLGAEVFHRGPDYDPAIDSVVRRQAHALRRKLDDYYRFEGQHDPIRIGIPVGHYVPVFEPSELPTPDAAPAPTPTQGHEGRRPLWVGIALIALVAAVSSLSYWAGLISAPTQTPIAQSKLLPVASGAIAELWAAWLDTEKGPLVSFSSPLAAVVKHFADPAPSASNPLRLILPQEQESAFRDALGLDQNGYVYVSPSTSEAKSGESFGAVLLANLFASQGLPVRTTKSTSLTWEDFRRENLIVFGHDEQNSWIDPLLEAYPLRLQVTSGTRPRRIVNTEPRDGEPGYYEIAYPGHQTDSTTEYALISMLPGTDEIHELLVISGLNTQATLMGTEFLTTQKHVEDLIARLKADDPQHTGPWHFQLVLRADVRDRVPTGGTIELVRVIGSE